jgi:carbon-monoxide dehydrogenase medium subunit
MIPASFDYLRAASLEHALALLAADDDAKVLAGGHSLIPLMRLRLATPSRLIDIGRLAELRHLRDEPGYLTIGALTRLTTLERDPVVRSRAGLIAAAAAQVGDPQVRHRGTIGGSVAHSDPASDLPTALLALDAQYVLASQAGTRLVKASDFHVDFLQTAMRPDEILTEIRVPAGIPRFAFEKFRGRSIDWAVVGVAVAAAPDGTRVALANMGVTPLRATAVEEALAAGATSPDAAQQAAESTSPPADTVASAGFRQHLARVLVGRALAEVDANVQKEGMAG